MLEFGFSVFFVAHGSSGVSVREGRQLEPVAAVKEQTDSDMLFKNVSQEAMGKKEMVVGGDDKAGLDTIASSRRSASCDTN